MELWSYFVLSSVMNWIDSPYNTDLQVYREMPYLYGARVIIPILRYSVLHGCKTWSRNWRKEHGLIIIQYRTLRIVFVSKKEEETRGWRKFRSERLCDMYSVSPYRGLWRGKCMQHGPARKHTKHLGGKPWRNVSVWKVYNEVKR